MFDRERIGVVFTVLPGCQRMRLLVTRPARYYLYCRLTVDVVLDNMPRARDFLVSSKEGYFEPGVRAVVGAYIW